jgi:hypothetical protein
MTYDPTLGDLVLFGGSNGVADTWAWNGTNWLQLHPLHHPSARLGVALAFNPEQHQLLLYGGFYVDNPLLDGNFKDTWSFNGSDWTQLSTAHEPSARDSTAVSYDPVRKQIVLFGGDVGGYGVSVVGETWVWTGSDWQRLKLRTQPKPRGFNSMAYDPAFQQMLLFGGFLGESVLLGEASDTWNFT